MTLEAEKPHPSNVGGSRESFGLGWKEKIVFRRHIFVRAVLRSHKNCFMKVLGCNRDEKAVVLQPKMPRMTHLYL